jgi:hypothetical protein
MVTNYLSLIYLYVTFYIWSFMANLLQVLLVNAQLQDGTDFCSFSTGEGHLDRHTNLRTFNSKGDEGASPHMVESSTSGAQFSGLLHYNKDSAALELAEDDSAIRMQPSRHVDYLSHDWREEDIWASWRHITSIKCTYDNSARLENAIWRAWIKRKDDLKVIDSAALNW